MANGDGTSEEVDDFDVDQLEVNSASWLRNVDAHRLDDRVVSWTKFNIPDIPEEPGDLIFVLNKQMRPDLLADKFYGRRRLWWVIAIANGIREPLTQLYEGREVRIPNPDRIRERVQSQGEF